MSATTPELSPSSLWLPPSISMPLQEIAVAFHNIPDGSEDLDLERKLASRLARESRRYFGVQPTGDDAAFTYNDRKISVNYTAERALDEGIGNCGAHSHATGSVGSFLNLIMRHHWDGSHVTNLWYTTNRVWMIDSEQAGAHMLYPYPHLHLQHLAADALHQARMYIQQEQKEQDKPYLRTTPIIGDLGNNPSAYDRVRLVLGVPEGVQMIKAIGKRAGYASLGRLAELSPAELQELQARIPPKKIPVPKIMLPASYVVSQLLSRRRNPS